METVTFWIAVNPCNGERITFTGTAKSQMTLVDTREHLDAGTGCTWSSSSMFRRPASGQEPGPPTQSMTSSMRALIRRT